LNVKDAQIETTKRKKGKRQLRMTATADILTLRAVKPLGHFPSALTIQLNGLLGWIGTYKASNKRFSSAHCALLPTGSKRLEPATICYTQEGSNQSNFSSEPSFLFLSSQGVPVEPKEHTMA
jgi:hypothetical protein